MIEMPVGDDDSPDVANVEIFAEIPPHGVEAFGNLLAQNGLQIHAADIGGLSSRTVRLDLTTGGVTVKTPGTNLYSL